MWKGCRNWRTGGEGSWQKACQRILGEEGEGKNRMRELEEKRRKEEEARGRRRDSELMRECS